jgi:hypothetical protein
VAVGAAVDVAHVRKIFALKCIDKKEDTTHPLSRNKKMSAHNVANISIVLEWVADSHGRL